MNSYFDRSTPSSWVSEDAGGDSSGSSGSTYTTAAGFTNLFRSRHGEGVRFAELLDRVSAVDPEMRVRFTSPHPKVRFLYHWALKVPTPPHVVVSAEPQRSI